ncbi:hypothetical protein ACOMHN_025677 [Nucella lapillus]
MAAKQTKFRMSTYLDYTTPRPDSRLRPEKCVVCIVTIVERSTEKCAVFIVTIVERSTEKCVVCIVLNVERSTEKCVVCIVTIVERSTENCVVCIVTIVERSTEKCVVFIVPKVESIAEQDEVTTQESVNRRQSDTTVGPQSLHDMCPGVEHLTNPNDKRNKRNVFLQVNVSDCDNLPENPYRQGVIYGLCNTSTTFSLHHTFVCDFRHDCQDKADESFCEHPSCSGFLCSNGQCVLLSQRCNQFSDCLDDSDEVDCPEDPTHVSWFKDGRKKQRFFVSLDGTGYFTQQVMRADEACPVSHYSCTSEWLYCLPVYTRCNGISDCVYGEDEQTCEAMTCSGFYQCQASRICVHGYHLCDGWGQCPQRDDELLCGMTCPEGCQCQGHVFLCNRPFPSDLFPQLKYLDGTGSTMSLTDFNKNSYLSVLILSRCSLQNISLTELWNLRSQWQDQQREEKLVKVLKSRLVKTAKCHVMSK